MNEPAPLPDDLLEYLEAAREPEPVPQATRDRLFAGLGPFLPPGGGGGGPSGDGGGGAPIDGAATGGAATGGATTVATAASGLLKGKLVVATVSAMIGALGGATMHATLAPPRTVIVSASVAAPLAPPEVLPVAVTSVAPTPSVEVPPEASVVSPWSSSSAIASPALPKSSIRAERVLLEAANAALKRGDHATALASLREHARSYPRGELAPERDILISQANKLKAAEKK